MGRVVLSQNAEKTMNVKNKGHINKKEPLVFTFANFHISSIKIDKKFNNFYKSENEYMRKMSVLIGKALPLLSRETVEIFSDVAKMETLHLHKIKDKSDILEEILRKYDFSDDMIANMLEGEDIYQFELPYENGATRVVFQKVDNTISFLFMDPNHHIYFNHNKVEESGSLFFDKCPVYNEYMCPRMDYFGTCFAFEFLDENKYNETYGYSVIGSGE